MFTGEEILDNLDIYRITKTLHDTIAQISSVGLYGVGWWGVLGCQNNLNTLNTSQTQILCRFYEDIVYW